MQNWNQKVGKAWLVWGLTGMDLNSGPPATGKGEIGPMRLGREKAGECASKVWALVLTMCSFGLSLKSDMQNLWAVECSVKSGTGGRGASTTLGHFTFKGVILPENVKPVLWQWGILGPFTKLLAGQEKPYKKCVGTRTCWKTPC